MARASSQLLGARELTPREPSGLVLVEDTLAILSDI